MELFLEELSGHICTKMTFWYALNISILWILVLPWRDTLIKSGRALLIQVFLGSVDIVFWEMFIPNIISLYM